MSRQKVLLMGKHNSGKTSMRSIIFANYLAGDTMRLSKTLGVEHTHVRFLGDLVLNLWDCGGQEDFYKSYFERDRETIFRSVEILIYVFDIESDCPEAEFHHFDGVLDALEENSPEASVFCLIHKMDLVAQEDQAIILEDRRRLIEERCTAHAVRNFRCYGTSIWDETLYVAWSEIVTVLIPNIEVLRANLDEFCRICGAEEVVLFERATFLVVSHTGVSDDHDRYYDSHRFEKISNIIKQFKLSCGKSQSQFQGMEVRNSRFSAYLEPFTANTYVMVIVSSSKNKNESGDSNSSAATLLNIRNARSHFEKTSYFS